MIIDYLRQHLKISPNDKPAEYIWVGKELSRDMHDLYIYCETGRRSIKAINTLKRYGIKALNIKGGMKAWKNETVH